MSTDCVSLVTAQLQADEGFRAHVYKDTKGLDTIGYGFCIPAGISKFAAAALLKAQVQERLIALVEYPWFKALDPVRAAVFLEMSFNDGLEGMLHFTDTIHYASIRDWTNAAAALMRSKVAQDPKTHGRYLKLSNMLLTGIA